MKRIIGILFILNLTSACCEPMIEATVENSIQRTYYVDCLRLNEIDFGLKDDGTILIIGKESVERFDLLDGIIHDASGERNLDICTPNNYSTKSK